MPKNEDGYDCLPSLENIDAYRLATGIVFTVWSITALCSLLFLIFLLFLVSRRAQTPIFKLMNCLFASQVCFMFSYCVLMLPCTYTKCLFYSQTVNIILAAPHTLGYYSKIAFNCLIAFERISMFLSKSVYHFIETHTLLYVSIGWFVGFFTIFITTVIGCYKM